MTQQAAYAIFVGYLLRFDNYVLELIVICPNIVFYTMEMRFIMNKELKIVIGEIGPVEIELLTTSLLLTGWFFGSQNLQTPLSLITGIDLFGSL